MKIEYFFCPNDGWFSRAITNDAEYILARIELNLHFKIEHTKMPQFLWNYELVTHDWLVEMGKLQKVI